MAVPCAGCGKAMCSSLPVGEALCHPCRRRVKSESRCAARDCARPVVVLTRDGQRLCAMHYRRLQRNGSLDGRRQGRPRQGRCTVCDCLIGVGQRGPIGGRCADHRYSTSCKRCGSRYFRTKGGSGSYCSDECKFVERKCAQCGEAFQVTYGNIRSGKFCSPRCKSLHRTEAVRLHRPRHRWNCIVCGVLVLGPENGCGVPGRFCKAHKRSMGNPRRKARDLARKARMRGPSADVDTFSNLEIFERDGWVCGLCDETVDKRLKYPDPKSASLDHVVPLSLGGPHTRANVQLAHFDCNVRKGNRVDLEMAV